DAFIVRVPSHLLVTGGGGADVSAPVLSAVSLATVGGTNATIAWSSSEPADSQVDYGPSAAYGSSTVRSAAYVTSHSQGLSGLLAGTQYHYRVRSRDAAGNLSLSADQTFTTSLDNPAVGMSAWWTLDEGAGTVIADATGSGHGGLLVNGPARIAGRTGLAVAFDGVNDTASVPHHAALDAYPLSTAFWMKTGATGITALVNKYAASSLNGWQVFTGGGNLCAWYFRNASNYVWDGGGCTMAVAGINDNAWHHVVFVVDATGGRLYVDGALRASQGWTGTPGPATTTQPLTFASYPGTTGPPLAGALDDVRVYGRALGSSEIAALANVPARDLTPPVISQMTARTLLSTSTMMVGWQTDELSDTRLIYGPTAGYGSVTPLTTTPMRSHYVTLGGLMPGTVYHCRAISRDAAGNSTTSPDYVFTTPAAGVTTTTD
ncbi:MAG TPA: LamG-like jellyroll fold domain-containing protein, partial [Candidatus Polarisedimenticolia bacterium]|nr:LamG-like jellyroll fold domain-containing protein [Candidatus Polarisedimenticolia bacterium]